MQFMHYIRFNYGVSTEYLYGWYLEKFSVARFKITMSGYANTDFYNAMLLYGLLYFIKYFVVVLFVWVALVYFTFVKLNKLLRPL